VTQLSTSEQALLEVVATARIGHNMTSGQQDRNVDLAGAYRIQAARASGQRIKGFKIGLISPAKQMQMGVDRPIFGRIFPKMMLEGHANLAQFIQPRVEPEIALILRDGISPDARDSSIHAAIGGYFLGVDILDSIWEGYKFSLPEVVADGTSGGAFLTGSRVLPGIPEGDLTLYLNGTLLSSGPTSALGDVPNRLRWLAAEVGNLEAGSVIFLGSPAAAMPAGPGTLELVSSAGVLSARLT
jgi:2-keto-4-pentenoate hydratase